MRALPIGTRPLLRTLGGQPIDRHVLDDKHRIGIVDGAAHQAIGIGRSGGRHDFEPSAVSKPGFEEIAMLAGGRKARARHGANDDRHMGLAARHVAQFGSVIVDHVHGDGSEVHEHDLGDRLIASEACSDSRTHDRLLGNRCRPNAMLAKAGGKTLGAAGYAAFFRIGHVLAEHEHLGILFHRVGERHVQGFDDRRLSFLGLHLGSWIAHATSPDTSLVNSLASGNGASSAKATASSSSASNFASISASSASVATPVEISFVR